MATKYNRWYILPTTDTDNDEYMAGSPKYVTDNPDIDGFAGTIVDESAFVGTYDGLITQFPDRMWYIMRVYATGNSGYQALDEISANYQDTRTLSTNEAFIVDVLDQRTNLSPSDISDVNDGFNIDH